MTKRIESRALVVRAIPHREADLVATFFTETDGKLGAVVRGARTSKKRFGGALEPIHELWIALDDRGGDLGALREARIVTARHGIAANLSAMEAAGQALRWVRHLCPVRTPEPGVWNELRALFDAIDAEPSVAGTGDARLAAFGLRLLSEMGYGLDFERCARCGKPCPEGRAACVDAKRGGVVCTACGGARSTMNATIRAAAVRMQHEPYASLGSVADAARVVLALVEEAMVAHAELGRT